MNENMQAFLEKVSQDEEALKRFTTIDSKEGIVALSEELGTPITLEDLEEQEGQAELSEDEVGDVAGGRMSWQYMPQKYCSDCFCFAGGGGTGDVLQKTCACVFAGAGLMTEDGEKLAADDQIWHMGKAVMNCPLIGMPYGK